MQSTKFSTEAKQKIPMDPRALIDTVGQIFCKKGPLRGILLDYMEANSAKTLEQDEYVNSQIEFIAKVVPEKRKVRLHRDLTHQRKKIQITIQLYRDFDADNKKDEQEWCVVGQDLQEVFRFLPKAVQNDLSLTPPKRGTNHSRWYPLKNNFTVLKRIALELRMLQVYISASGEIVGARIMQDPGDAKKISDSDELTVGSSNGSSMIDHGQGVLDLDMRVDYSCFEKFGQKTKVDLLQIVRPYFRSKGNPYRVSHGVFIYNKNGTPTSVVTAVTSSLEIPHVHRTHISPKNTSKSAEMNQEYLQSLESMLVTFRDSSDVVAMMSVNHHSLFWVRHRNVFYLCDPWKRQFSPGHHCEEVLTSLFDKVFGQKPASFSDSSVPADSVTSQVIDKIEKVDRKTEMTREETSWMFLPRDYNEQYKHEGSCSVASLSRVLQLGVDLSLMKDLSVFDELSVDEFKQYVQTSITECCAMLASCLVRTQILRVKRDSQ
ncbi:hypothetical protein YASMINEVIRUS_48 [Yasminevirus sp. GU-2018]|uniref:Uncharacterized protein n=1 Tax=Yasminevirus sp. GU-2018 TaxID=2420051 RepID=A0A5K0U701_9VIRU|nr:hypothetical protein YASMINEVIRUS_48 [Yasminevirus sp. GU-2018]